MIKMITMIMKDDDQNDYNDDQNDYNDDKG
jgi:hypothetical protein